MKLKNVILSIAFLLSCLFCNTVNAQGFDAVSNPRVKIKISHPPGLGLKLDKVSFNTSPGNCSEQLENTLISHFVESGIDVIDRANLESILAEHDLSLSGYVDKSKASSIGKIIGPSALISIKVLRCETEIKDNLYEDKEKTNYKTKQKYVERTYISRTLVHMKVSVQTTDLTTGKIFSAQVFEHSPYLERKSTEGRPEAPSEFEVQEATYQYFVRDINKLFFEWTETAELYFFNDRKGGLKNAFNALKDGDIEKAHSISVSNLEDCKTNSEIKKKVLAHAYYNVGMMKFIENDYDAALPYFDEAKKIRPGDIVDNAIDKCKEAKSLSEEMLKVDESAALAMEKMVSEESQRKSEEAKNTLSNSDVIDLVKKKLPSALIIQKIKTSKCCFETNTDALVELTENGVPEDVIMEMMSKQ